MDILDALEPFFTHLTDEDRAKGVALGLTGALPLLRGNATPAQVASAEQKRIRHIQAFYNEAVISPMRKPRHTERQYEIIGAALMGEDRLIWWRKVHQDYQSDTYLRYGTRAAYKRLRPDLAISLNLRSIDGCFVGKDADHAEVMLKAGDEGLM